MLDLLSDSEELELLIDAIEEMAKRNLEAAKELYFKDFKDLDFTLKVFYQKNLENLLKIEKSN